MLIGKDEWTSNRILYMGDLRKDQIISTIVNDTRYSFYVNACGHIV